MVSIDTKVALVVVFALFTTQAFAELGQTLAFADPGAFERQLPPAVPRHKATATEAARSGSDHQSVDRYTRLGAGYYRQARYPDAISAFQDALLLIRRQEGVQSVRQLEILDWLTVSYIQNREPGKADAQQRFYHYISLVNLGKNNPLMLAPTLRLADWYRMRGQLDDALFAFEDALTLIERNELNEFEKLEPLRGLSYIMTRQQGICCEVKEDLAKQAMTFSLSRNMYADDDPRLLSAMNKMADWMISTGQLTAAVQTYEQALDLLGSNGSASKKRLDLLYNITSAKHLSGGCCADEPMTRVLRMVQKPGFSEQDRLSALIHIGNLNTLSGHDRRAGQYYRMAWNAADSARSALAGVLRDPELLGVNGIEAVADAFHRSREDLGFWASVSGDLGTSKEPVIGSPLGLCRSQAQQLARAGSPRVLSNYYVDLSFTVRQDGGVSNITVKGSNAPEPLQRYVTNTLNQSRYRPALRDGVPIDSHGVSLHQTFSGAQLEDSILNRVAGDSEKVVSMGCELLALGA